MGTNLEQGSQGLGERMEQGRGGWRSGPVLAEGIWVLMGLHGTLDCGEGRHGGRGIAEPVAVRL